MRLTIKHKTWGNKVTLAIASPWFFRGVLALFTLNALWAALSYRFPSLFDASYHLGLIQFYAHQWSPLITHQPPQMDSYGDIVHNPSFLYHYLMSFPYRFITDLTDNRVVRIGFMRSLNIAMVVAGLWLFRRVLLRLGLSKAKVHIGLLLFSLMPITSFLAAQINYDNMLFPLTALSVLLCQEILRRRNISYLLLATFAVVAMVSALVKYTFLPLLVAEVLFVGAVLGRRHGWAELWQALRGSFSATPKGRRLAVVAVFVLVGCVFVGRYGDNIIHYGTPSPECNQVLSVARCKAYGVWYRNYQFTAEHRSVSKDPTIFSHDWAGIIREDMFRVGADTSPDNTPQYSPVYRVMKMAAGMTVVVGAVFLVYYWRPIRRSLMAWFFITISAAYVVALWLQNYTDYIHTGQYVGTQGRYMLPILPLIIGVLLMAYTEFIKTRLRQACAFGLLLFVLICFTQGGGALAGIAAGNSSWYWTGFWTAGANQSLQKVIKPLVHA